MINGFVKIYRQHKNVLKMNARRSKETNKELYATSSDGQLIWVIYFVKYLRAYPLKIGVEWIILLYLQLDKYI